MFKKVYAIIKSDGIGGLLRNVYRRIFPHRLEYYSHVKSIFQSGAGLEIGGPSGIFKRRGCIPVYPVATKIDNCNFGSHTVWEGAISGGDTFIFDKRKVPGHQYVTEASNLEQIDDSSYDYVLSSHCIEHLANPLQGLSEWVRVLKKDGILVLALPHKDGTFDHNRPITSLHHMIQDFENKTDECDLTHLEEILRLHDLSKDPGAGDLQSFEERSKKNIENRCLHHHVFNTRLAVEVVNYMRLQIVAVELFAPYDIVVIAKNIGREEAINNDRFRGIDSALYTLSPFKSDRETSLETYS